MRIKLTVRVRLMTAWEREECWFAEVAVVERALVPFSNTAIPSSTLCTSSSTAPKTSRPVKVKGAKMEATLVPAFYTQGWSEQEYALVYP